jgi:hypothetical protein
MQEIARILDETRALIRDQPDAIKLYGSNPSKGMEFNSLFRNTLRTTRKRGSLNLG